MGALSYYGFSANWDDIVYRGNIGNTKVYTIRSQTCALLKSAAAISRSSVHSVHFLIHPSTMLINVFIGLNTSEVSILRYLWLILGIRWWKKIIIIIKITESLQCNIERVHIFFREALLHTVLWTNTKGYTSFILIRDGVQSIGMPLTSRNTPFLKPSQLQPITPTAYHLLIKIRTS